MCRPGEPDDGADEEATVRANQRVIRGTPTARHAWGELPMSEQTQLVDRFVVGVDVERYSARNVRQQDETQHALDQILSKAASAAGLDRQLWVTAPGGDGELAILPGDVDMVAVVGRFVAELDDRLGTFNEDRVPVMKL